MILRGAHLRAARKLAGLYLRDIAPAGEVSGAHLSLVERGERPVTAHIIDLYETALGYPITVVNGVVTVTDLPQSGRSLDGMDRRSLGVIAAAAVGSALVHPLGPLLDSLARPVPKRVGEDEVAAVHTALDMYTAIDLRFGGGMAVEMAHGALRWAESLLGLPMTAPVRARLYRAVAALADRVAWCLYDNGDQVAASALFAFALNLAALSDDPDLRAHVLLNTSTQLYDLDRASDAVAILRMGLGDDRVSPAERANLHLICARHCAGMNDRPAALRHLGLAEEAQARADSDSVLGPWASRVHVPGHLDFNTAMAMFALGEQDTARTAFTAALTRLGDGRIRTKVRCQARMVMLWMQAGEPDQAHAEARRLTTACRGMRSARVRADLSMVRAAAVAHKLPDLAAELPKVPAP